VKGGAAGQELAFELVTVEMLDYFGETEKNSFGITKRVSVATDGDIEADNRVEATARFHHITDAIRAYMDGEGITSATMAQAVKELHGESWGDGETFCGERNLSDFLKSELWRAVDGIGKPRAFSDGWRLEPTGKVRIKAKLGFELVDRSQGLPEDAKAN
jgi:hypothetical protein